MTAPNDMREFLSQGRDGDITHMLRCCEAGRIAYGGFAWPESGPVSAPDWSSEKACGNGLHGWLMGAGDVYASDHHANDDAVWIVCAVFAVDVVDLGGKVKVPRAWVTFAGSRSDAVDRIVRMVATGVVYSTLTGGDGSTLTGGYGSTLTGGDDSTLTGGHRSTLTGGDGSTLTGGENSSLAFMRWNGKRYKLVVVYTGEDGLDPGKPYRCDDDGKIVRADGAK